MKPKTRSVLVLGGCRFLGWETANALAEKGHRVHVVDDWPCPGEPVSELSVSRGDLVYGLRDLDGFDVVYNFYEFEGVVEARLNPREAWKANVEVVNNLAWRIVDSKTVATVVQLSSAAVYGDPEDVPSREGDPLEPVNTYGATRASGEVLLRGIMEERGIHYVVLRVYNVYGPGGWNRRNPGVVYSMIRDAISRGYIRIEGDGAQVRDFIHLSDAVEALVTAYSLDRGVYNLGSGRATRILDLAGIIARVHGRPLDVVWAPPRPGDVRRSLADISKLSAAGWSPRIPLEAGVRHLYNVVKKRLGTPTR